MTDARLNNLDKLEVVLSSVSEFLLQASQEKHSSDCAKRCRRLRSYAYEETR